MFVDFPHDVVITAVYGQKAFTITGGKYLFYFSSGHRGQHHDQDGYSGGPV